MMNNLARIVSHGFSIVVVLLLGIGFIYRGELFPDLDLPDFLVPESERVAGAGDTQGNVQRDMAPTQETAPGESVETVSTAPIDESVVVVPAAPAVEATAAASKAGVESQQPATGIAPSPAAEESMPGPGEGETAYRGEAGGATGTEVVPVPVPSSITPSRPQAGVAGSGPGAEPPSAGADTVAEPEASGVLSTPQTGAQTPNGMPEPYPVAPPPQESATNTERATASAAAASTARAQAADTVAEQPPQSSAVAVKPNELLAAAREAFWLHNYDAAEKNYRALAELEPRNPDGYGELGNMYFTQGRWEEAAAAYYEAGIRLVREGHIQTARDLVNVIRGLNGSQAGELEKLITSATTSGIR